MGQDSRGRVADAWKAGTPAQGTNVFTDGQSVFSYGHKVGETDERGRKIAFDCRFSVTTAKHCSAFKGRANVVKACGPHEAGNIPTR